MKTIEEILVLLDGLDGCGIIVTDVDLIVAELEAQGYEHDTVSK